MLDLTVDVDHSFYVVADGSGSGSDGSGSGSGVAERSVDGSVSNGVLVHNESCGSGFFYTKHALVSLKKRNFDDVDIAFIASSSNVYEQSGGELVHVAQVGSDSFHVVIQHENRIITAMRGKSFSELKNLATRYQWNGF